MPGPSSSTASAARPSSSRRSHTDRRPRRRVPQRVLDQRAPDLEHTLLVAERRDARRLPDALERVLAAAGATGSNSSAQQLARPAPRSTGSRSRCIRPASSRERSSSSVGQLRQALDLLAHAGEELAPASARRAPHRSSSSRMSSEREERRAQLVRGVGDELTAGSLELRQAHAHALERTGQLAELVVGCVDDGLVEAAARDPVGRLLQSADPARKDAGAAVADQRGATNSAISSGGQEPALDESDGLVGIARASSRQGRRSRERRARRSRRSAFRRARRCPPGGRSCLTARRATGSSARSSASSPPPESANVASVKGESVDDLEHDCARVRRARDALAPTRWSATPRERHAIVRRSSRSRPAYLILTRVDQPAARVTGRRSSRRPRARPRRPRAARGSSARRRSGRSRLTARGSGSRRRERSGSARGRSGRSPASPAGGGRARRSCAAHGRPHRPRRPRAARAG